MGRIAWKPRAEQSEQQYRLALRDIDRLEAENERLREALEGWLSHIAVLHPLIWPCEYCLNFAQKARAAVEGKDAPALEEAP